MYKMSLRNISGLWTFYL